MIRFYRHEQVEFERFYKIPLTEQQAHKIVSELVYHFELPSVRVIFRKMTRSSGRYMIREKIIKLAPETNLGVVVHEFSHHMDLLINGRYYEKTIKVGRATIVRRVKRKFHTKALKNCMQRSFKAVCDNVGWGVFDEVLGPGVEDMYKDLMQTYYDLCTKHYVLTGLEPFVHDIDLDVVLPAHEPYRGEIMYTEKWHSKLHNVKTSSLSRNVIFDIFKRLDNLHPYLSIKYGMLMDELYSDHDKMLMVKRSHTKTFINDKTYNNMTKKEEKMMSEKQTVSPGWKKTSEYVPEKGGPYREWTNAAGVKVLITRHPNEEAEVKGRGVRYVYRVGKKDVDEAPIFNETVASGEAARQLAYGLMAEQEQS